MNNDPPTDPYASAPQRLGALIDEVLCTCPNATLIVAQIIESGNSGTSSRVTTYNAAVPGVVAERANKGFKVMVRTFHAISVSPCSRISHADRELSQTVDMSSIGVGGNDLVDGLHPTDYGYNEMATLWYQALQQASSKGWITTPDAAVSGSGSAQECSSGLFWYPANNANQIASGVGSAGTQQFQNNWVSQGQVASGLGLNGTGVTFCDLDGDGMSSLHVRFRQADSGQARTTMSG